MLAKLRVAGAALLLLGSAPVWAQADAAPQAASSKHTAALALAELVAPGDVLIPIELSLGKQGLAMGLQSEPEGKQLMQEYPGLVDSLWAAVEPEFRKHSLEQHPGFLAELAKIYVAHLSLAELETVRAFYATPTGRKLMRGVYTNVDPTPVFNDALKAEGAQISQQALDKVQAAAVAKTVNAIGPDDQQALEQLMRGISPDKMRSVGEMTQKFTAEWVNKNDPAFDAHTQKLLEAALEKFLTEEAPSR